MLPAKHDVARDRNGYFPLMHFFLCTLCCQSVIKMSTAGNSFHCWIGIFVKLPIIILLHEIFTSRSLEAELFLLWSHRSRQNGSVAVAARNRVGTNVCGV